MKGERYDVASDGGILNLVGSICSAPGDEGEWICAPCSCRNSAAWLDCDACLRPRRALLDRGASGPIDLHGSDRPAGPPARTDSRADNTWIFTPRCFELPEPPPHIGRIRSLPLAKAPCISPSPGVRQLLAPQVARLRPCSQLLRVCESGDPRVPAVPLSRWRLLRQQTRFTRRRIP